MKKFLCIAILGLCSLVLAPSVFATDVDYSPTEKVVLKKDVKFQSVIFVECEDKNAELNFEKNTSVAIEYTNIPTPINLSNEFDPVGTGNYLRLYCSDNRKQILFYPNSKANTDPFNIELFPDHPTA